jgi:hypothetical protein
MVYCKTELKMNGDKASPCFKPFLIRIISDKCLPTLLTSYERISPGPRNMYPFHNKASLYGEKLLATRPTPKLRDHPFSAVHDCLFNIFAATLHTGGLSSIRKLWTRHAVVTGTPLSWASNNNRGNNNNNHQAVNVYWLGWKYS